MSTQEYKFGTWYPIETAPKDERILLFDHDIPVCGCWVGQDQIDDEMFDDDLDPGWYEENLYHSDYDKYYYGLQPTHWMPLPERPEEKE